MRARDVIGRRIVGVRQQRLRDNAGRQVYHLDELELEDGTVLKFDTANCEDYSIVKATVWKGNR